MGRESWYSLIFTGLPIPYVSISSDNNRKDFLLRPWAASTRGLGLGDRDGLRRGLSPD